MSAALIALLISAVPHEAPAPQAAPARQAATVQTYDALVATEESPSTKDLFQRAIFRREGRGPAIAVPPSSRSIA